MKNLCFLFGALGLAFAANAQETQIAAPKTATDRAAAIHQYALSLRQQATTEVRELARQLALNEAEMQLAREFVTARLQAEQEAQARLNLSVEERRTLYDEAQTAYQSRLVNILTDSQLQTYFNLLAAEAENEARTNTLTLTR